MKIFEYEDYKDGSLIGIDNGDEKYNFVHIIDMHENGEFKLGEYFREKKDGTQLRIIGSLDDTSLILVNNASSRSIRMGKNGTVLSDVIRYNKHGEKNSVYSNKEIPKDVNIRDYLSLIPKNFVNDEGMYLKNDFLLDEEFVHFIELNDNSKDILTKALGDSEKDIFARGYVKKLEKALNVK